jgi:mannose-6-phosphate isomerase-like protein (cupin superfamily)
LEKINIKEKFARFKEQWKPKILAEVNDCYVKAVRLQGEFVWHSHPHEDEMFLVIDGKLTIKFRPGEGVASGHQGDVELLPGEFIVIPRGVEHLPVAEKEVQILLFEPKTTLNTGNVQNERTVPELEWV